MRIAVLLLAAALCAAQPAAAQGTREPAGQPEEGFSFYGLRFGMSPEQVKAVFRTNEAGTEAIAPGHGMMYLVFTYDFRNRLSEIRASYERPADRLREYALRQVLKEKFIQPVAARRQGVSADLDESYNRAAITLVILSLELQQEAVDYFKDQYLQQMK